MITLLQAAAYHTEDAFANFTSSEAFILTIIIAIAGYFVQARLQSVFNKYSKVPSPGGMSGAEAAERMLRENNVHNVKITHVNGHLTDHFNPQTMTVNLSDSVYESRSVAAIAVACHECGHAIQHARGYAPLELRSKLVPIVSFSSRFASWVIIGGLLLMATTQNEIVCWVGIGMIAMSALFSIVTLPVEYNASDRALEWMQSSRLMNAAELEGAKTSLRWAARTYLVAALSAIATVIYYISIVMGNRRSN